MIYWIVYCVTTYVVALVFIKCNPEPDASEDTETLNQDCHTAVIFLLSPIAVPFLLLCFGLCCLSKKLS